jgi:hypothetical protein
MLGILILSAKEDKQTEGLIPHILEEGVLILQYADDAIIFMQNDLEIAL